MEEDSYITIAAPAEVSVRERASKFIAFAYPVESEVEVKAYLDVLKKKYYDATHHCYAWRIGAEDPQTRMNDDGEPSGTAGRPILGQILSAGLTNILVVVVRYFGGTKLGVPGLISAYKEAAQEVIDAAEKVEKNVEELFRIKFPYETMNGVMKVVKEMEPKVISQVFDNVCEMELSIRKGLAGTLRGKLEKCGGLTIEEND